MRYSIVAAAVVLLLAAAPGTAPAQGPPVRMADTARIYVYPTELYPGENVITVSSAVGIQEIVSSPNSSLVLVQGDGRFSCQKTQNLRVFVRTASEPVQLKLQIYDCLGRTAHQTLPINQTWSIDREDFGRVEQGTSRCRIFKIGLTGTGFREDVILDSVSIADPRLTLEIGTSLPYTIPLNSVYRYRVCFQADKPGFYQFPITTWIRRRMPNGGFTTYPVADTGIAMVVPPPRYERRPITEPEDPIEDLAVTDPTTFRSVAVPNAIIPKKGRWVLGVYDFFGLMGAYSLTDNIMIQGGGAIPTPDDWTGVRGQMYGAYSIGAKAGVALGGGLNIAAGFQWAQSVYDEEITPDLLESKITLRVPWGAISFGDDDSRISATFGYAMKRHVKPLIEFDENATIFALGGDYRLANHWKIAGEVATMQTLGVVPIILTGRYFSDTYAIDFGLGYAGITTEGGTPPAIPVFPVLSGVFVF